ncbi:MAG TPA: BLUF domain-containing protein [Streptosporangiaceae bacterium]|nr:BLUF domain-containing protein [Streptosporangiaceae bacterium]
MTGPDASQDSGNTFRLIYRSRNTIPAGRRKAELGLLFSAARSNNKRRHITGALLIQGDWFAQVLEGDETVVRALFAEIEHDPRHTDVSLIESGLAGPRRFARWAMARVSADGQPDIPLIAHQDGISPAASRGTTPDQEAILDIMRQATRTDAPAR